MGCQRSVEQRGVVLPLLAVAMLAIIGIAGMAIDGSRLMLNQSRLQAALDAAALSGARTLNDSKGNVALATTHAQDAFQQHLFGEMGDDPMTLEIEYSASLNPFVVSNINPTFVRVRVVDFERPFTLSRVLPGVAAQASISATAVAGPAPLGGPNSQVCDVAPLLVCGDASDTDASDGTLFGITYDDGSGSDNYCLKASTESPDNGGQGGSTDWSSVCSNWPIDSTGPGNFQLIQLDCGAGGDCVRDNLAGEYESCLTDSDSVLTKPGNTVGPTAQGFNTRFGEYLGGMSEQDYPADKYTVEGSYNQYVAAYQNLGESDPGVANRRIMAVPIGDCGTNDMGGGQQSVPVMGFGCFFMSQKAGRSGQDNYIVGALVEGCTASGSIGTDPTTEGWDYLPKKIVLYNDPDWEGA